MVSPEAEWFDPPWLEVRPSPIAGRGLFTTKACRAGERLLIIAGEVIDEDECDRREVEENNCVIYVLDDDHYIDPVGSLKCRSLNHSCQPNSEPFGRDSATLWLTALRDIAAGEELTIDYDYPEIYELCQAVNPRCLREQCPLRARYSAAAAP